MIARKVGWKRAFMASWSRRSIPEKRHRHEWSKINWLSWMKPYFGTDHLELTSGCGNRRICEWQIRLHVRGICGSNQSARKAARCWADYNGTGWRDVCVLQTISSTAMRLKIDCRICTPKNMHFRVTKSIYEAGRRFLKWFIKSEPKILSNSCSKAKSTPVKGNKDSKLVFRITNESYTDRSIRSPSSAVKFLEMTTI